MSNFTGVTFAQQKVLPSDDAIIRRSLLSDGVLYGCELSYSGSTLTMGAGQLLICGRQIRHPSAQNWAVTDATSGFARLVITVDLTRTASKEVFEQVVESIQYATAQDGFPELNKTDVNTTGSVYQVAVCTVSLGAGGITGIVDQIGPCEPVGGGGLNFKVVGGLAQPTGPVENTIWVKTDYPISGYYFTAAEPSGLLDGEVWVSTGTSSPVAFNALRENTIEVYPIAAKQYIGGAWVSVEAKSYQNGEWVGWYNGTLYDGNWYAGFEFVAFPKGQVSGEIGSISIDNASEPVTVTARAGHGAYIADVDVTDYNTLEVCYELSGSNGWINFGFATDLDWRDNKSTGFVAVKSHQWTDVAKTTQTLDISALSGKYPFKLNMYNTTFTMWSLRMLK